jgi:ribosomal protein S12 methylthiotransferase accessory factor
MKDKTSDKTNPQSEKPLEYKLELTATAAATGYFTCRPAEDLGMDDIISLLRCTPFDEFMHTLLLNRLCALPEKDLAAFSQEAQDDDDPLLTAVGYEAGLLGKMPLPIKKRIDKIDPRALTPHTPLIIIKNKSAKDHDLHRKWISLFKENLLGHHPLPRPENNPLPLLFDPKCLEIQYAYRTDIAAIHQKHGSGKTDSSFFSLEQTTQKALEILEETGILDGGEMRHESSLSPYSLLRRWRMSVSVQNGRHRYRLSGIQTSYGRGLSLNAARASNLMEILERYASFAGFEGTRIKGYRSGYEMVHSSFSSMEDKGLSALDPNQLCLESVYQDEKLYWMEAGTPGDGKYKSTWVPAQIVFPFCNLDEPCLFSGLGTTGLASGNTMAQAKVAALLEIFERDAEAIMPYDLSQCFRVESHEKDISLLLDAYKSAGIDVVFQDLTSAFGIPCCKCFVRGLDGSVSKGVGAHLSARKALVSAMTETPYPFPHGPESAKLPGGLVMVPLERLPDYSTGNPDLDLAILEDILSQNHLTPIYVDLTRKDTGIPVVRAVVPGLEIMADFDEFSRVSPRLFHNYLDLWKKI